MIGFLLKGLFRLVGKLSKSLSAAQERIAELEKDSKATFRINAKRDSRTCNICKTFDRRRVTLPTRNGFVAYGELTKKKGWGSENVIPPFHPRCRCTLKPVFGL